MTLLPIRSPELAELARSRLGDWIQTYSGRKYWPTDPRPEDVCIADVAHALSQLCRFGGHCTEFYSVAEHSVHVSHLVHPFNALQALLHDATEAYCVDVPRPLKRFLVNYDEIEDRNWQAISAHFGVPYEMHPSVKLADNRILLSEQEALMPDAPGDWFLAGKGLVKPDVKIIAYPPKMAEVQFLSRFRELTS